MLCCIWLVGAVAAAQDDEDRARASYDAALQAAREAGQKEWIWRTLEARGRLLTEVGQDLAARRDGEEALSVLEGIATRLPRDLREVFWDDPRRRAVRMSQVGTFASAATSVNLADPGHMRIRSMNALSFSAGSSTLGALPAEERLTRLLEINRELAKEHKHEPLLKRVTDHAISLVNAERGFVILAQDGKLVLHTSRNRQGDATHTEFSRNIAERVIATGEPVVTLSAREDERMADSSLGSPAQRTIGCLRSDSRSRQPNGRRLVRRNPSPPRGSLPR